MLLTAESPAAALAAWDLTQARSVTPVEGGELKDVYRVELDDQVFALRVYPQDVTPDVVASELELVNEFAKRLPEVPASITTAAGAQFAVDQSGRIAVLTQFIEGTHPDGALAADRQAAAEMLARLHAAASEIANPQPRPDCPAWTVLDWQNNQWWSWPLVRRYLQEADLSQMPHLGSSVLERRLEQQLTSQRAELAAIAGVDLPVIPLHNDFFEGNLIMRDGRIVGLVDWDEARVDWRAWEIANATWSFSRAIGEHRMDVPSAKEFLAAYVAAGGEVTEDERSVLVPLMRARLLWETLYELGGACQGAEIDWEYLYGNLTALDDVDESFRLGLI